MKVLWISTCWKSRVFIVGVVPINHIGFVGHLLIPFKKCFIFGNIDQSCVGARYCEIDDTPHHLLEHFLLSAIEGKANVFISWVILESDECHLNFVVL